MQQNPYPEERPVPGAGGYPDERTVPDARNYPVEEPVVDPNVAPYPPARGPYPSQRARIYRSGRAIGYVGWFFAVLEILLLLRFFFKLIGADPYNPFAVFLYALTGFFTYIFRGIVPNGVFGSSSQYVFEWSTLIAMIIYGILAWILISFLRTRVTPPQQYIE